MYRGPHNSGPYRQGSRQVGEAGRRLRVGTIFPRNNARPNKTADSRSRSLRSLNIRYLKTVHGDLLDMEDTVGAIFDDRADFPDKMSSIEILPTSIVQVYRYPPEPQELANIPRYGSLMPESSARPRKRPLTIPAQISRTNDRAIATIEGLDDMQQEENFLEPNKRQRTLEVHGDRPYGLCGKYQSGEALEAGLNRAPQGPGRPGRPGSIHQVDDSQKSPARRRRSTMYYTFA